MGVNLYGKPSSSTEAYILFESMGDVIRNVRIARDVHAAKEGGGDWNVRGVDEAAFTAAYVYHTYQCHGERDFEWLPGSVSEPD